MVASDANPQLLQNGQAVDRVEGLNIMELVRKLKSLQSRVEMPPLVAGEKRVSGPTHCSKVQMLKGSCSCPTILIYHCN